MKDKQAYNPYSTKNAFFVAAAIGLFQHLLLTTTSLLNFESDSRRVIAQGSMFHDIFVSYIGSVILLFLLLKFSFWIAKKTIEPHKKHLIILFGLIAITVPLSFLFSYLYDFILSNPRMYLEKTLYKKLMQDIIFAFIVFLITVSISSLVYNQKLSAENIRNRYEILKNQLDPHFLFNSLNTLDGLIGYDDSKAHDYLQNLSLTFRHAIQNKDITELNEELKLVDAYSYLMKIRYGENFRLDYKVNDEFRNNLILPISLQLLIENAIKHNIINDKHPLSISIEATEKGKIKVRNNRNPKIDKGSETGIGLANLAERYLLMFNKKIKVEDNPDFFSVELPLIEQINK